MKKAFELRQERGEVLDKAMALVEAAEAESVTGASVV